MKVCLINPPFRILNKSRFAYSQCLGLRSISAYLKVAGNHDVYLLDALAEGDSNFNKRSFAYTVGLDIEDILARISADTDLIGLSVPFSELAPVGHEICDQIKMRFPQTLLIMGGIYPSTQPRLALTSKADYIIVGEGEIAFRKIADGDHPNEIKGVYSKNHLEYESFPSAEVYKNLDELPPPDCSVPSMQKYIKLSPRGIRSLTASVFTSRGCPFDCEFCSVHPICGYKWRARSSEHVLDEIEYYVKNFGVHRIEIEDDNFTLKLDRAAKILEGIIYRNEQGANLQWNALNGLRIDTLNKEFIALMKRSKCYRIYFAIEHGDPDMLRIMNKRLNLEKAYQLIEECVIQGIPRIGIYIIVGYPGETLKRFQKSYQYLGKIHKLDNTIFTSPCIAQPYPGTKLLARCRAEGYIKDPDFDNFLIRKDMMGTSFTVSITTPDFNAEEVIRRRKQILALNKFPLWRTIAQRCTPQWIKNNIHYILKKYSI